MASSEKQLSRAAAIIGQRIREARKQIPGMTQEKLALLIGAAGQSTIGNYERGENEPSFETLQRIAEVTGQSIAFLTSEYSLQAQQAQPGYDATSTRYAMVKRLDVQAGAGIPQENGHEEISGTHAYRRDWLEKRGLFASACAVIEVKGESMEPTICDGDVVLINTAERKIKSGNIYAFRTEEGVRLKRLHRQLDGRVRVTSDNPNKNSYPDEWLTPDSEAEIIGIVVHRSGGV